MYCGHCGNYMAEGSAVCPRCGTQTAEDASPASGASSWSSASGQTDDRMDPSAPSSGVVAGPAGKSPESVMVWRPAGKSPAADCPVVPGPAAEPSGPVLVRG